MYKHMNITPEVLRRPRPGQPLYDQIADVLRSEIIRLKMAKGTLLPSMIEMAQLFGVHRHTIRQAMDVLEREGIIEINDARRKGKIVVAKDLTQYPVFEVKTQLATHMAFTTGAEIELISTDRCHDLSIIPVPETQKCDSYQQLKRVHSKNGHVFAFVELFIASRMFDEKPEDFQEQLVLRATVAFLGKENVRGIHQTMTIIKANKELAHHLKIPRSEPVARFARIILDSQGKAAYVGNIYYPGNAIEIRMDMEF